VSGKRKQAMFAAVYKFKVKEGKDKAFIDNWKALTQLILQYEGSFGSRLHRSSKGVYIAYALWPDSNTWKNSGENLPTIAEHIRAAMQATCDDIRTLHQMELVEDMIQEQTSPSR
jgi:quinol monooxygenase YgiN